MKRQALETKLARAAQRAEAHVGDLAARARKENRKVEEVEFMTRLDEAPEAKREVRRRAQPTSHPRPHPAPLPLAWCSATV